MRSHLVSLIVFATLLSSVIAVPINFATYAGLTGQGVAAETVEDIISPLPGQYVNYTNDAYYLDGRLKYRGWWNTSYLYYVQPHVINSTHTVVRPEFQNGTRWLTIDKTNRWVVNGTHWWNETWYPGWIETNVKKGSVINFWTGTERISGSQTIAWNDLEIDTWLIDFTDPHGYEKDLMYFDKQTGVLVKCLTTYTLLDFTENQTLAETNIPIGGHDVAVTSITPSQTRAYSGSTAIHIFVNATNHGKFSETFSVTAFYNSTTIETQTVTNLAPNANATIIFLWDITSVPLGYYTISAMATRVPSEIDLADNSFTDGSIAITISGNVDGDRDVDVYDLLLFSKAFSSDSSKPNWNPNCDFNNDKKVDDADLFALNNNYGKAI